MVSINFFILAKTNSYLIKAIFSGYKSIFGWEERVVCIA
jgi:hypothetical protein